jgi:signal transduction histidine kinase
MKYYEHQNNLQKGIKKLEENTDRNIILLKEKIKSETENLNRIIDLIKSGDKSTALELFNKHDADHYNSIFNIMEKTNDKISNSITEIEMISNEYKNNKFYSFIVLFVITASYIIIIIMFFIIQNLNLKRIIIEKDKNELININNFKNNFFSIVSHDLRNPFTSIIGFMDMLKLEMSTCTKDTKCGEYATIVKESADNYFNILDDLLKWSKSQMSRLEIKTEKVNIADLIHNVLGLYNTMLTEKKISIETDIQKPSIIKTDSEILKTVIRNLISNAIKFSFTGSTIVIRTGIHADKSFSISIKDTGVGLQTDKIFTPLEFASKSTGTCGESGSGIGLIICSQLIEKIHGKISIESEQGKGSIFRIELSNCII